MLDYHKANTPALRMILCAFIVIISCLQAGPLFAEPDASGIKLAVIPVLSGYPPDTEVPLPVALGLPKDISLPIDNEKHPIGYTVDNQDMFEISGVSMGPIREGQTSRKGMVVMQLLLKPAKGLRPGAASFKGTLSLPTIEKGVIQLKFDLPVNILPGGEQPRVLNPQMLQAVMQRLQLDLMGPPQPPEPAKPVEEDPYAGTSLWWTLLLVLGGGLALNLTPCVYPMIPITVSFFGGRSQGSKGVLAMHSVVYLLGLAVTYSVLGAFVSLSGRMLGDALTSPWVTGLAAGVLLIMASSMFGLWEIKMPASLNRVASADRAGVFGTLIMGLTVGILAAPCVGPFVVGLMTHVGKVGELGYGLLLFFVFSIGLGLPLSVMAFFSGSIHKLPRAGDWMVWVRKFFGVVLVLMAVYIARPLIGDELFSYVMAGAALIGALYLGLMEKSGQGGFKLVKRIAALVLILAVAGYFWWTMPGLGPKPTSIAWQKFSPGLLEQAAKDGKPVVVDFAADWCAPCKRMEAETFPDARVVKGLTNFVTLKADVTKGPSAELRPYAQAWRIRGVPSLIFLDKKGKELPELRLVGYRGPDDLAKHLQTVLKKLEEG
jgi:thiol:disulfide interchange protein DsbD